MNRKRIQAFEPWFFLFFGLFHLHRIWALADRHSYAAFWMNLLEEKGLFYYLLMGLLAALCLLGIAAFIRNRRNNFWWRWVYVGGGAYLLFDLFAIAANLTFWRQLLAKMFDTSAPYWTALWLLFILLGALSFALGVFLLWKRGRQDRFGESR